jgi:3-isopropylmalate dehydrogenase
MVNRRPCSWSVSIPSARPSRAIPTATGSSPPPIFFGDILSDQASGLAGGVGIAPSLNAGGEHAMAQAVHGTAPDIAGKGIANPAALILSTALLLNWFYQRTRIAACRATARLLDRGVRDAIAGGAATPDLGGHASTDAFATAAIAALEAA